MNAGAYGHEFKDALVTADVIYRDGRRETLTPDQMEMRYRHTNVATDTIFTGGVFQGEVGLPAAIDQRMMAIKQARAESQPIRTKTGGSTFANPDGHKAWELIDRAGCRGLMIGGAQMSEMHCNFMLNAQNATAADLERLGEEVRRRVLDNSGVTLRWEVKRVGIPLDKDTDIAALMTPTGGSHAA